METLKNDKNKWKTRLISETINIITIKNTNTMKVILKQLQTIFDDNQSELLPV